MLRCTIKSFENQSLGSPTCHTYRPSDSQPTKLRRTDLGSLKDILIGRNQNSQIAMLAHDLIVRSFNKLKHLAFSTTINTRALPRVTSQIQTKVFSRENLLRCPKYESFGFSFVLGSQSFEQWRPQRQRKVRVEERERGRRQCPNPSKLAFNFLSVVSAGS